MSKSPFLLTDGVCEIGLVSKSRFLLTAGLWKIGSVSKSRFLLTGDKFIIHKIVNSGTSGEQDEGNWPL